MTATAAPATAVSGQPSPPSITTIAPPPARRRRLPVPDVALALLFALVAAAGSWAGQRTVGPAVRAPAVTDVWFDGDIPRVAGTLADRWDDRHRRSTVHPLLPTLTLATYAWRAVTRTHEAASVTAVIVGVAFLWGAALFALLRAVGCGRGDAALLTALGLGSAAATFWLTVPESFGPGSVTIVLGLLPAALAARGQRPREGWFVAGSAATFAITTTNWMAGLLAAASAFSWRRALQISVNAFAVVTLIWGVQKALVPHAGFFLERLDEERQFVARPTPERLWEVGRVFFARAMVAPRPVVIAREYPVPAAADAPPAAGPTPMLAGRALSVQRAPGAGSPWGWVATTSWLALLVLGAWSLRDGRAGLGRFRGVIVLFLAGQLALHVVYGKETFLYSLDYLPALLLVAAAALVGPRGGGDAAAAGSRYRLLARACAVVTLLGAVLDNVPQFRRSSAFVASEATAAAATVAAHAAHESAVTLPASPTR